jgi:hypothetical protein
VVVAVNSAGDLAMLAERTHAELVETGRRDWENPTLDRFLEALAAVAESGPFGSTPTWADVARLLVMATGYE